MKKQKIIDASERKNLDTITGWLKANAKDNVILYGRNGIKSYNCPECGSTRSKIVFKCDRLKLNEIWEYIPLTKVKLTLENGLFLTHKIIAK